MRPYPVFIFIVTFVPALPLCAQRAATRPASGVVSADARDSLAPGVPLRLSLRRVAGSPFAVDGSPVRIGTFAGWRADTLLVRFRPHGSPAAIPPAMLRSLERGVGRRPSVGGAVAGSVAGLAVGVLTGALVSALNRQPCPEGPCGAVAPVLGGAAGIVLGAAYGFERGTPKWVTVPLH